MRREVRELRRADEDEEVGVRDLSIMNKGRLRSMYLYLIRPWLEATLGMLWTRLPGTLKTLKVTSGNTQDSTLPVVFVLWRIVAEDKEVELRLSVGVRV